MKINVVYIGPQSFPIGGATTKRRRYMIDYMNNHNIQSHYLVCDFKQRGKPVNKIKGVYGLCDYYDIEAERNAPSTRNSCQAAWFYKSHKASLEELIEKFKNK